MWLELQIFGFRALWSPYFLTAMLLIAVLYYLFTGPFRHVFGDVAKPTLNNQLFFYSGVILLYILKGSPIDLLSHIMMSAHMGQMAFLYMVLPILLIRGLPVWMWEKFVNLPVINGIFKFFTQTLIALMVFNSFFTLYHIPSIFDYSKSTQFAHIFVLVFLFIAAVFMWWPIVTPLKSHQKLMPLLKMGYLLISIVFISIACALIIFATNPLFASYSSEGPWLQSMALCVPADVLTGLEASLSGAEMFSPLSALEDQQLGGIIMMFLQQIIYGLVIAWVFFGWFSKKNLQVDPMPESLSE